jgi:5-formyltetrahydrofolate cyclo-ligase
MPEDKDRPGSFIQRIRRYGDDVLHEIHDAVNPTIVHPLNMNLFAERRDTMRERYCCAVAAMAVERRSELSAKIEAHVELLPLFLKARVIMVTIGAETEVETALWIQLMLQNGKRIVLAYARESDSGVGIGEIQNVETDLIRGQNGRLEPVPTKRDNVFRTDLQLVLCHGIAFDVHGSRLGSDDDRLSPLLREIKGRVPLVGIAFGCQILDEYLPMAYQGVRVDQIVTENGPLLVEM